MPAQVERGTDVLDGYWEAVESLDADGVAGRFSEGGAFYFGDEPAVQGRVAIRRAFMRLFTELDGIQHEPVVLWTQDGLIVSEADVKIDLADGGTVTVPITTVLRTKTNAIVTCRVLLYPEPALQRATSGFRLVPKKS